MAAKRFTVDGTSVGVIDEDETGNQKTVTPPPVPADQSGLTVNTSVRSDGVEVDGTEALITEAEERPRVQTWILYRGRRRTPWREAESWCGLRCIGYIYIPMRIESKCAMSWEFKKIADGFALTEGPVWDGDGLIFSDFPSDRILQIDHITCEWTTIRTGTNGANGLKYGPDGHLYGCEGKGPRRVVRYEEDGRVTVVADEYEGKRLNAPNDLVIDGEGRIWFTDPNYPVHDEGFDFDYGAVYRADPVGDNEWNLKQVIDDTEKPNGILLSPDKSTLYVAETHHKWGRGNRELRAYTVHDDGSVGDFEVLHNFFPHRSIDGMCLDEEGNIVATAGGENNGPGPMIYVFAPNGRVLETHPFPADQPTNCAFGGPDLRTLYVTNFEQAGDEDQFDKTTASLHRAKTDRSGLLGAPDNDLERTALHNERK